MYQPTVEQLRFSSEKLKEAENDLQKNYEELVRQVIKWQRDETEATRALEFEILKDISKKMEDKSDKIRQQQTLVSNAIAYNHGSIDESLLKTNFDVDLEIDTKYSEEMNKLNGKFGNMKVDEPKKETQTIFDNYENSWHPLKPQYVDDCGHWLALAYYYSSKKNDEHSEKESTINTTPIYQDEYPSENGCNLLSAKFIKNLDRPNSEWLLKTSDKKTELPPAPVPAHFREEDCELAPSFSGNHAFLSAMARIQNSDDANWLHGCEDNDAETDNSSAAVTVIDTDDFEEIQNYIDGSSLMDYEMDEMSAQDNDLQEWRHIFNRIQGNHQWLRQ